MLTGTLQRHPVLLYAVEDYEFLETEDIPEHLYRYADNADGHWWAGQWINAKMHGRGFHTDPKMWKVPYVPQMVLARIRTRFETTYSPAESIFA